MKICTLMGTGFEEIEAIGTVAILKRSGLEVDLFGLDGNTEAGKHQIEVTNMKPMEELNSSDYDALLIPGGPHYSALEASGQVQSVIRQFHESRKVIAAICAAPTILGRMGLLKGKRYTCFTSMNEDFGGTYVDQYTVTDGSLITGRSAAATIDFAFAVIEKLQGPEQKKKIQEQIYY